ncbi:proline iminopeptidase [Ulvibacter sp. MAR_2010_11]|uniref:proline iminopeptidase-family hydrolase n=1 Tax=Ulvibacter sp. MAR_2010_11 TaxID=1250229 RepID=UPI000C2BF6E8|nr:proline iminopeptidase-family hydrolase [Ulvibacter sp. MAR_2010_11]PKA83092.1 proline iminopeptidase [Ulvibacter sp. MAR_2010_11]
MKSPIFSLFTIMFLLLGCSEKQHEHAATDCNDSYFDYSNSEDQLTGGIKMIPITTEKGTFDVWTKRVGNNPKMKVLLLHGGPGGTHEFFESFDGFMPKEGIEYIYYDQLDSYYSDQPNDSTLWTTKHFVEEVEQVRKALGLDNNNFYLLGQSWGGILAMEYALKYQDNLKGLIVSNMMASIPEYEKYASEVLGPQMPAEIYAEIKAMEVKNDFGNPRYAELVTQHYYTEHFLRMPTDNWPESVNRAMKHLNPNIYIAMQGYSEFGITGDASLKGWDVSGKLNTLKVPTLMIGATYDTMDPKYMEWMASEVQNGRFLLCPNGSHLSQYDDPKNYFPGVIQFIKDVDSGAF